MNNSLHPVTSKPIIPPQPHSSQSEIKQFAREHAWKIAILPEEQVKRLQDSTSITTDEWFNTTGAAIYCLCQTHDSKRDWHNALMENRRKQNDSIAVLILGKTPRGNAERLGELECHKVKRKVYYTKQALDKWLKDMKPHTTH